METRAVVCNVYKLLRNGKKFSKEGKILERSNVVLLRDYVNEKNEFWFENGLWHEIDEEATKDYYSLKTKENEERKEKEMVEGKLKDVLTDVIKDGVKKVTKDNSEIKELRKQYKEKYGKNAFAGWDVDKLKEKLK